MIYHIIQNCGQTASWLLLTGYSNCRGTISRYHIVPKVEPWVRYVDCLSIKHVLGGREWYREIVPRQLL